MKILFAVAVFGLALAGCDIEPSSDDVQRQKQEQISQQGNQQVGMPAITNFAEKRMMKDILELRDQDVATTTYIVDLNGKTHKLCDSVGFGLPYATQFTNPQRVVHSGNGPVTLPQADPNGLFSPAAADGTWVQCVNPQTKKATVVYVEPRVIVSPFPLD